MASAPAFAATPRLSNVAISTANTNRDGTGTVGTVFTAGASGSRLERIRIMGVGTVTAGMVRLFIHDGSNYKLWKEIAVTATTPSGTVAGWEQEIDCSYNGAALLLPASYSLRASTHNAETFHVHAVGGDF